MTSYTRVLPIAFAFAMVLTDGLPHERLEAANVEFQRGAKAFLEQHCVSCHGQDLPASDLPLDDVPFDVANGDTSKLWQRIAEQVLFKEMPPADSGTRPSAQDREHFVNSVEAELKKVNHGLSLDEKMVRPEFGNLVDHEKLFSGEITTKPYTPARLWRQRPDIPQWIRSLEGSPIKTGWHAGRTEGACSRSVRQVHVKLLNSSA